MKVSARLRRLKGWKGWLKVTNASVQVNVFRCWAECWLYSTGNWMLNAEY